MTYDWEGDREVKEGTLDWYNQIDEEFWDISKTFAHQKYPNALPFSDLIDYPSLYDVNMTFTDGYIARHYTRKSAVRLFSSFSSVSTRVMDGKVPAMFRGWDMLTRILPIVMKPLNRWIVNRYGWFLLINIVK